MRWVRSGAGLLLLFALTCPGRADECSDLQAAITKTATLKGTMYREAGPILNMPTIPSKSVAACGASQNLRDHLVVLTRQINSKCLSDDQQRTIAGDLDRSLKEANENIGLFCN